MKNEVLILGGGVAGCALAWFLRKKGYLPTIVERKGKCVGGLARTYYYAGHPYEFGPHIWFWPDPSPINDTIRELTGGELYYITRHLKTFMESDRQTCRHPIHFADVKRMPDADVIISEMSNYRDENMKLIPDKLPELGKCSFGKYCAAVYGKTLFHKFSYNYAWKMWGIRPDELQTSIVWADMIKYHKEKMVGYDPVKFSDHPLGNDIAFQVYPKKGWNVVWERMAAGAALIKGQVLGVNAQKEILLADGSKLKMEDYDKVISTLDIGELFGEDSLQYSGRIIIPLLLPKNGFEEDLESMHFAGSEFQTRVTNMDLITRCKEDGQLILIEVPILSNHIDSMTFPENVIVNAKAKNLYAEKAYPVQSENALTRYQELRERGSAVFPNLLHCGRYAEFKYMGMPQTVDSAYRLVEEQF
ncbi:NAD(P)-binding protein [bacterium]|nr:NAD(P)-binding protein [bacterium]